MASITILLQFGEAGTSRTLAEVPGDLDSEDLPDVLVERGFEFIDLNVPPYTAKLFVSEDATFIVDSYEELRAIIQRRAPEAYHSTFLGDGEIVVDALIREDRVECEIKNCPQLDRRNLVSTRIEVSLQSYAYGWARAVEQLMAPLSSPGATGP